MILTAMSLAVVLTGSTVVTSSMPVEAARPLAAALESAGPAPAPAADQRDLRRFLVDEPSSRPKLLPALYVAFAAVQVADVYSTRRAVRAGAVEANPLMKEAAGSSSGMLIAKAASGAASIYFAEKMWKKNRKGAVLVMAAINGVTAAIVANNLRNARR